MKTFDALVQYMTIKRDDDLRIYANEFGEKRANKIATKKAIAYLASSHQEIPRSHYANILVGAGHKNVGEMLGQ